MILIGILALIVILIISGVSAELTETFSNPNWMGFEDREDEDYKRSDNINNYQEE